AGGPATAGPRRSRLTRAPVVGQVALAAALLVPTGLMVRSLVELAAVDAGFEADRVLVARVGLPPALYSDDASRLAFWRELHRELRALPGVAGVALTSHVPGPYLSGRETYRTEDTVGLGEREAPWTHRAVVSPGFFAAFGVGLLEGRDFAWADDAAAEPVTVVNRSLSRRVWPGESPVGRRLLLGGRADEGRWVTVVGVAPDLHLDGLRDVFRAGLYLPLEQQPRGAMNLVLRPAAGDALAQLAPVRDRVVALDPSLPVSDAQPVAALFSEGKFFYRMVATLFTVLGVAALLLATAGLYAVLSFSVAQRTAEMGIRMALGAARRQVCRLVVAQGLRQVALGLLLGLLLAPALALGVSRQLFGVHPLDPATFVAVPALMLSVAVLAAWTPARRATRVDPARALRRE
ncbi:MAG TPA: FtsX-like permease family protein, partial [Thermoanaerobaculia bacterium]|nr:FtsX-like permease family protein [Thermoanaerobaculia bacterium]